eukprot:COSAG01_NODE_5383_length_4295_cov_2.871306_5_plen_158_part_00
MWQASYSHQKVLYPSYCSWTERQVCVCGCGRLTVCLCVPAHQPARADSAPTCTRFRCGSLLLAAGSAHRWTIVHFLRQEGCTSRRASGCAGCVSSVDASGECNYGRWCLLARIITLPQMIHPVRERRSRCRRRLSRDSRRSDRLSSDAGLIDIAKTK